MNLKQVILEYDALYQVYSYVTCVIDIVQKHRGDNSQSFHICSNEIHVSYCLKFAKTLNIPNKWWVSALSSLTVHVSRAGRSNNTLLLPCKYLFALPLLSCCYKDVVFVSYYFGSIIGAADDKSRSSKHSTRTVNMKSVGVKVGNKVYLLSYINLYHGRTPFNPTVV